MLSKKNGEDKVYRGEMRQCIKHDYERKNIAITDYNTKSVMENSLCPNMTSIKNHLMIKNTM